MQYGVKEVLTMKINEQINRHDDLLTGITYDDLITAVQSNEPEVTEQTIIKTLEAMISDNLKDCRYLVKQNMEWIKKQI